MLFGAQLHFTGAADSHWGELEIAREALTDELAGDGAAPYAIPIGGSTAVGAVGYAVAFVELMQQCDAAAVEPAAVVFTSSSGGTHAGLRRRPRDLAFAGTPCARRRRRSASPRASTSACPTSLSWRATCSGSDRDARSCDR